MEKFGLVLLLLILVVPTYVTTADWYIVKEWEIVVVPDDRSFGLDWKEGQIYVVNWHLLPPYATNLYVHTEDGYFLYEQLDENLNIDCAGLDWKNDWDHGGKGWYLGSKNESMVYFVNENGTGYWEFYGPTNFNRVYGVVHNQDDDILYVSDWSAGRIAWGSLSDTGCVSSWTEETVGSKYCALEYIRNSGGNYYLLGLNRSYDYWDSELHIWKLDDDGIPNDVYEPDDVAYFGDTFYYPGDIGWDNENIWLLNQDYEGTAYPDAVTEIALPDYLSDLTVITPMSFGKVKTQFR